MRVPSVKMAFPGLRGVSSMPAGKLWLILAAMSKRPYFFGNQRSNWMKEGGGNVGPVACGTQFSRPLGAYIPCSKFGVRGMEAGPWGAAGLTARSICRAAPAASASL